MSMDRKRKGELTWDTMIPWLIAIAVLVVIFVFSFLLRDKLGSMGEYLQGILRR